MALRDRLASLSRGELAGLIVLLAITLGGAGLWYARSLPRPVEIGAPASSVGASGAPVATSASSAAAILIVDVAGEVRKPGVYEFAEGQRVIDAVNEAGGPTGKADLSFLNLAAPLTDGTQVLVPSSASVPGAPVGSGTTGGTALVNINTASTTELETLSGIGEVLAAEIVGYRTENGPFASVDELDEVSGIGPATLEDIRDQVTV
ncbi:MAG TPA: ComEA family DNA-binding protein [Actinomycetota bacterium]|jgi:competence protein ComEA|nr:ComEA family DNA-binding protein [Actinomycetota bacterium]